jgi:hypothetical protein
MEEYNINIRIIRTNAPPYRYGVREEGGGGCAMKTRGGELPPTPSV